ncbi:MAG: DUF2235 domain-containing protein [Planktomarina sp.]
MFDWLRALLKIGQPKVMATQTKAASKTIVIMIDGTLSSLKHGHETNVGLVKRQLANVEDENIRIYYEPGLQWTTWRSAWDVMTGNGIEHQIRRAYGALASWYEPGDRIILVGYSRGAYAVRSLAGVIDRVGLLKRVNATDRQVRKAWNYYAYDPNGAGVFAQIYCHPHVPIAALGVWDTVKALGLRLPLLWRLTEGRHAFHNHRLGTCTEAGFQALALDETRVAYSPVIWQGRDDWHGVLEQRWFEGTHSELGGQLDGDVTYRGLSNLSLAWMLKCLSEKGLPLPEGWQGQLHLDPDLKTRGQRGRFRWLFLARKRRPWGRYRSEEIDLSVDHDHPARRNF